MKRNQMLYAVEFTTKIEEGVIEVPEAHRARFKDNVRVILLAEEEMHEDGDMIAKLLTHPLNVPDFTPLTREDAHARS
jgi:hypothetical protein